MPDPVEAIVSTYVETAEGDRDQAFRRAVADALADLTEAERRVKRAGRLVSEGYVRAGGFERSGNSRAGGASNSTSMVERARRGNVQHPPLHLQRTPASLITIEHTPCSRS
jgi:hypothetical protein